MKCNEDRLRKNLERYAKAKREVAWKGTEEKIRKVLDIQ
jgi:hypothetical protein